MLCRRNETAKVATSITAGDCVAQRPEHERGPCASESASRTAKQKRIAEQRRPAARCERERVGAGHDQLAVGEVDEPQDAEDEADADGDQGVDRAERERVGEGLPVDVEDGGIMRGRPP